MIFELVEMAQNFFFPEVQASIISFTTETMDGITAYMGNLFTDLAPVIALVIGLPLAFWAIRRIIGLVRAR